MAFIAFGAHAQTYLKANSLYWIVGIPNISVETRLFPKWTFNADLVVSPWKSIKGKPYLIGQVIGDVRFYPKGAHNGFYAGAYAGFHPFKMSKWNYDSDKYQVGRGYSLGLTLGYELAISKRWMIDFSASGGWQRSKYHGFERDPRDEYVGWNGSGEWIPYKLAVSFGYRLGKNK